MHAVETAKGERETKQTPYYCTRKTIHPRRIDFQFVSVKVTRNCVHIARDCSLFVNKILECNTYTFLCINFFDSLTS